MVDGTVLGRGGIPYKPATYRSYERALRLTIVPALGALRLGEVQRRHVQAIVDAMRAEGLAAGTIHNQLDPLRVIFRRAIRDEILVVDPMVHLDLPANRARRDRVVAPAEADALLDALSTPDRAYWATALFAGLRRGELRGLRWKDVDLPGNVLKVERGWDDVEGEIDVKTTAARRKVPLIGRLRRELLELKLATGRDGEDLVFGRTATEPFVPSTLNRRAKKAWAARGLVGLTPHEARHCAASYFIAAGLNAKEISRYIGHSSVMTTFDHYGHLMPGGEADAVRTLNEFFERRAG